eukprot:2550715-Rhodomonas_salina.1
MQTAANARAKERQEQANHQWSVHFLASVNKDDDKYTYGLSRWDPTHSIPAAAYTTICLNVKQSSEYLNRAAVDSA